MCSAFYLGLAALQSGEDVRARSGLMRATEIAPGEPAPGSNLGLLQARQQEYDAAYQSLEKARILAPDNSRIESAPGFGGEQARKDGGDAGPLPESRCPGRRKSAAQYALAMETERQQTPTSDADALKVLDQILKLRPHNEPVLLDVVRLAAKLRDVGRLRGGGERNWAHGRVLARTRPAAIEPPGTGRKGFRFT